jgi:hypothetical protein
MLAVRTLTGFVTGPLIPALVLQAQTPRGVNQVLREAPDRL